MPKSNSSKEEYRCPTCGANFWQGPFDRGPIEEGELIVAEMVYSCVNCHAVCSHAQMVKAEKRGDVS
jgi:hypothetical protein